MKKYSLMTLVLILFACHSKPDPFHAYDNAIRNTDNEVFYSKDAILIVPNGGCEGCVSEAETFVLEHIDQTSNFNIVFTGTNSQKSLKLKLGEMVYNHPNVFIDHENEFYDQSTISFYPTVVYIKDGKITEVAYQSPETPYVLTSLDSLLKSEP